MNFSNTARSQLAKIPGLNGMIDKMTALYAAVWNVEHNDDGTHKAITSSGSITATGAIVSGGAGTFAGNVTADSDGTPVQIGGSLGTSAGTEGASGPGIDINGLSAGAPRLAAIAFAGTFPEIRFLWRTASDAVVPFQLRYESGTTSYRFMPGKTTNVSFPCYLGSDTDSFGAGRWAKIFGQIIDASTGYLERGRSVYLGEWTTFTPTRTASAGTWTVGTLLTANYMLIGKTLWVTFYITGTSVSNAGVELRVAIPGGFVSAKDQWSLIHANDNGAGTVAATLVVTAGGTILRCFATTAAGGFAIAATTTDVKFAVAIEVQ